MKDLMKNINDICKKMSMSNVLMLVGVVALAYVLCNQSKRMGQEMAGMENNENADANGSQHSVVKGYDDSDNQKGSPYSGSAGPKVNGTGNCGKINEDVNPTDLLPKNGTAHDSLVPNQVNNDQLLKAGHHCGVNTVGSSLRNPNLQLRAEPSIPKGNPSPWMQSTMDPQNGQGL